MFADCRVENTEHTHTTCRPGRAVALPPISTNSSLLMWVLQLKKKKDNKNKGFNDWTITVAAKGTL